MYAVSVSNKDISWTHSAWDPTEPVATRPLFTQRGMGYKFFYTFDGNKNVSELVHFETRNGIAAHYDYAPFGAVTRAISASAVADNTFTTDNPFRFSSEYHDDTLGLVYYNYRHYNPIDGRWCGRDEDETLSQSNLYLMCYNSINHNFDSCGRAFFALRPLEGWPWLLFLSQNPLDDFFNTEISHEQLFFEDGKTPISVGFFKDGTVKPEEFTNNYRITKIGFNDCVMRHALKYVELEPYSLLWFNCQDYAEQLREIYSIVIQNPCIKCLCGVE